MNGGITSQAVPPGAAATPEKGRIERGKPIVKKSTARKPPVDKSSLARQAERAETAPPAPIIDTAAQDAALLQTADESIRRRDAFEAEERTRANPRTSAAPGSRRSQDMRKIDASQVPKEFLDEDGKVLTRRKDDGRNPYDIPRHLQKPGWAYKYDTIRVLNEPVDPSNIVAIRDGGWRQVPPSQMPELVPPGWDKQHIERGGQILYMRPQYLEDEAKAEQLEKAEAQRYDKLQGALAGPAELAKVGVRYQAEKFELEGRVGTTDKG